MASESKTSIASTYCSPSLEDAWRRFGDFDKNASIAQKRFLKQRKWIIMLGVIVTTLAVVDFMLEKSLINDQHWFTIALRGLLSGTGIEFDAVVSAVGSTLNIIIIIIPILISILVAGAVKFNMGINWVMLRSASESIKHEIFRYRTQIGIYSPDYVPPSGKPETRDVTLARRIKQIGKRVMETQVNMSELEIYDYKREGLPPVYGVAPGDDGFSDLTADQYIHWRIEDQFDYYRSKARKLAKELQQFQWSIYIFGGLGTLLAAIQMEIWVAVTSALVAALGSFLEFKRVETNLIGMNLAASDLYDIRAWWRALSESAKQQPANKATLVKNAEAIIQGENASWLTEMREALSEVYGEEDGDDKGEDGDGDRKSTIAILPDRVNDLSEEGASAAAAFDSIVKGEGGSWLSAMKATLAGSDEPMDESGDGAGYKEEKEPSIGDVSDDAEWVGHDDEIPYSSEASGDEMDDDSFGMGDAFVEEVVEGDRPIIGNNTAAESKEDNWLDTPTQFDESLDSILDGNTPAASDSFASVDEGIHAATGPGEDPIATGTHLNGSSALDAAIQMDLPDGYEADLHAFADPFGDELAPAPFQRAPGDNPEDEDEDEDVTVHLTPMGEVVPTPFQRLPGDNPELESLEDQEPSISTNS